MRSRSNTRSLAVGRASTWPGREFAKVLTVLAIVAVTMAGCRDASAEAVEYELAGDWASALGVYERVLAEDPDDLEALSGAAVALMALQRYDEALGYQERVVAADAKDVQTRVELGFNYLNHQDRPEDAVRVLGEAAWLERTAKHLTFVAQAQDVVGDQSAAEGTLREAIEVDPTYGYAYGKLASLLEEQGRTVDAEQVRAEARSRGIEIK